MSESIFSDECIERRERVRFKTKANCSFCSFEPSQYRNEFSVCKVKNIGTGGLAFLSDQECKPKTRLLFTIALQDYDAEEPINAIGEVIWINCSKFTKQYCIGVKFINMLEDDRLNLTRRLN